MVHIIPYEADFHCEKCGTTFTARASPFGKEPAKVRCMVCFNRWVAANVPEAVQVSPAKECPQTTTLACD